MNSGGLKCRISLDSEDSSLSMKHLKGSGYSLDENRSQDNFCLGLDKDEKKKQFLHGLNCMIKCGVTTQCKAGKPHVTKDSILRYEYCSTY